MGSAPSSPVPAALDNGTKPPQPVKHRARRVAEFREDVFAGYQLVLRPICRGAAEGGHGGGVSIFGVTPLQVNDRLL